MKTRMRGATAVAAVGALAFPLAACGSLLGGSDSPSSSRSAAGDDVKVGLLLPESETARYEKFDQPIIDKHVKELTHGKGRVLYANAGGSEPKQRAQMQKMIDEKVDVILVDAVDAKSIKPAVEKAKKANIFVIAYDRLAEGPVDGYVTFDGGLVGQVQGQALLEAMGKNTGQKSKVVMVNGAPTDPNAALFKQGATSELQNNVDIAKSYDTAGWKPQVAEAHMTEAIKELGAENIDGVYSANDGMAGGIITALKKAGLTVLPPVTGQDAELPAVQRIVAGEQYMSVYKPYPEEAVGAAEMAVMIAQDRTIEFDAMAQDKSDSASEKNVPSLLVPVRPLTKKTIKSTVIEDGIYKVKEICTPKYEAACRSIGLMK